MEASRAEQARLRLFWDDLANPDHAGLLADAGITHVIVPDSGDTPFRWQEAARPFARASVPDYLRLVFEAGGARVYALDSP